VIGPVQQTVLKMQVHKYHNVFRFVFCPFPYKSCIQFAFLGAAGIFMSLFLINPREHASALTANPSILLTKTNKLCLLATRPNSKTWPPYGSRSTEPPWTLHGATVGVRQDPTILKVCWDQKSGRRNRKCTFTQDN